VEMFEVDNYFVDYSYNFLWKKSPPYLLFQTFVVIIIFLFVVIDLYAPNYFKRVKGNSSPLCFTFATKEHP
jgi:hypothetical protein